MSLMCNLLCVLLFHLLHLIHFTHDCRLNSKTPRGVCLCPGLLRAAVLQEPEHVPAHGPPGVLCGGGRPELQQPRGAERRVRRSGLQERLPGPAGLLGVAHQPVVRAASGSDFMHDAHMHTVS